MYLGVRAVIAQSIERIHQANLINFCIVPIRFADPADYDRLQAGDELVIEDLLGAIRSSDEVEDPQARRLLCLPGQAGAVRPRPGHPAVGGPAELYAHEGAWMRSSSACSGPAGPSRASLRTSSPSRWAGRWPQAGFAIANGGYRGTMHAAAKGAAEAGGTVIGVTCSAFKNSVANEYVTREIVAGSLEERLETLVELGRATSSCRAAPVRCWSWRWSGS